VNDRSNVLFVDSDSKRRSRDDAIELVGDPSVDDGFAFFIGRLSVKASDALVSR